jgi:two-component system phosphate regulon response regulator PhoB
MRILIADDDRVFAELTATRLRNCGFEVAIALDSPTALMSAVKHPPDLILLDIRMPGGSGLDTLKRLKASARTEPVPVIIVTASPDPLAEEVARENGAHAYLQKPVETETLIAEIRLLTGSS